MFWTKFILRKTNCLQLNYETWTAFDRYKQTDNVPMEEYVTKFEKLYTKAKKFKLDLPEPVLAFKLLDCSGLSHKDRQLTD